MAAVTCRAGTFGTVRIDPASGLLAYTPASGKPVDYSLVWVDRNGGRREINDLRRGYEDLHLSPDGRRVALTVEEAGPDAR